MSEVEWISWDECIEYKVGDLIRHNGHLVEITATNKTEAKLVLVNTNIHHGPVIKRGKGKYKKW